MTATIIPQNRLFHRLRQEQSYLNLTFGVKRLGIFGSYAKGTPRPDSDVDIIIEFERPIGLKFITLVDYLEQQLGKKIDVLTPMGMKTSRLSQVGQAIEESVIYV